MTAIAVVGPTGSGKSDLAIEIAKRCNGEIVSVDSMQVYRHLDIGTAKATAEMQSVVAHHMLDLVEPEHDMSVAEFQTAGRAVLADLEQRSATPVICGGSGLHFRSLVDPLEFPPSDSDLRADIDRLGLGEAQRRLLGVDAAAAEHIDMANQRRVSRALEIFELTGLTPTQRSEHPAAKAVKDYRPEINFVALGLDPGPAVGELVEQRFDAMLARGLLEEVRSLRSRLGRLASQGVGYKELLPVVAGEAGLADGRSAAIRATKALAKRQRTFFGRDPRIHWLAWDPDPAVLLQAALDRLDGLAKWNS